MKVPFWFTLLFYDMRPLWLTQTSFPWPLWYFSIAILYFHKILWWLSSLIETRKRNILIALFWVLIMNTGALLSADGMDLMTGMMAIQPFIMIMCFSFNFRKLSCEQSSQKPCWSFRKIWHCIRQDLIQFGLFLVSHKYCLSDCVNALWCLLFTIDLNL